MNLHIVSICLDGMPYLPLHLPEFEKLKVDWTWHIVHGASANTGSTRWCRPQMPRLSRDGSSEYINGLTKHPKVRVYQRQWWAGGKDEMVNAPLAGIQEECVLLQVDIDELWKSAQIEKIVKLFEDRKDAMRAFFFCRYWLGKNIVAKGENCYSNRRGEWLRAFRFKPEMFFSAHEPPILSGNQGNYISREEARALGLVFDHYSWCEEKNVRSKLKFYGYGEDAIAGWLRLQEQKQFPVKLNQFFHWVDNVVEVECVKNIG